MYPRFVSFLQVRWYTRLKAARLRARAATRPVASGEIVVSHAVPFFCIKAPDSWRFKAVDVGVSLCRRKSGPELDSTAAARAGFRAVEENKLGHYFCGVNHGHESFSKMAEHQQKKKRPMRFAAREIDVFFNASFAPQ